MLQIISNCTETKYIFQANSLFTLWTKQKRGTLSNRNLIWQHHSVFQRASLNLRSNFLGNVQVEIEASNCSYAKLHAADT